MSLAHSSPGGTLFPMRGKFFYWVRQVHTLLGVFFSPLLLLFVITGWWQTFVTSDDADKGAFNQAMSRFSNIHTNDYYFSHNGQSHTSHHFQILVAVMAVALIFTILLGLIIACQDRRKVGWRVLAFALGIGVPAVVLYFN